MAGFSRCAWQACIIARFGRASEVPQASGDTSNREYRHPESGYITAVQLNAWSNCCHRPSPSCDAKYHCSHTSDGTPNERTDDLAFPLHYYLTSSSMVKLQLDIFTDHRYAGINCNQYLTN